MQNYAEKVVCKICLTPFCTVDHTKSDKDELGQLIEKLEQSNA